MLIKAKTLKGYKLDSYDGEIGKVKEFYFDDQYWTIRYLVADTGNWLTGRQVLISPYALVGAIKEEERLVVSLTRKQIENSPPLDSDKPVSRQFEETYYGYYGWPTYWSGPYTWGTNPDLMRDRAEWKSPVQGGKAWDPNLRSTHEVSGYHIEATDGEIGHVEDFVIDDVTWAIRYIIVDTTNWLPGQEVLVSPRWIDSVSWDKSKVFVNLTRDAVKQSPGYLDESSLNRDYETELHRHYNRQGYWVDEAAAQSSSR
jgi:uncharacterized protein YrrD